ncbi:MAG: hypothetical protein LBK46_04595 [Oscillospiraceae bacterium]|jgi:tRNA(Ile)-lysidine synthase TilS/MesJ|nr:hypothetical protein [Oscillospiraceae bacterium]
MQSPIDQTSGKTSEHTPKQLSFRALMERDIFKARRKTLWTPFMHAIRDYQLIQPGDRIAVCVSGGKDSNLLAVLMGMLERVTSVPFTLKYLTMDPGYMPEDRALLESNAQRLALPISIFGTDLFEIVRKAGPGHCYLCARMRRGHLYKQAQEMGCNKIALAHHYNDAVETVLMGLLYGAQVQTMMPKLHSKNYPGMELIRPLYLVREQDVLAWRERHGLTFLRCGCPLNDCPIDPLNPANHNASKRGETKRLIAQIKKTHPAVEQCIFKAVHQVNLNTLPGYIQDGRLQRFTDTYGDGTGMNEPVQLKFAKLRHGATIPAKRAEDAGWDIYACADGESIRIEPGETRLIPTGIASAFGAEWYMQLQERGSMGAKGVAVRGGVIDSGFRGEWLVGLTNHNSLPIVIADEARRQEWSSSGEALIILPVEKAICQAVLLPVPEAVAAEVSLEELQGIPSERGCGMLGSSDK